MYKKMFVIIFILLFLVGCGQASEKGKLKKVGLLVPETINDQVWGTKGYKGLLKIQSELNVDVFYKEGMNSEAAVREAVEEFHGKGVNLIIGHGHEYEGFFRDLLDQYPDIHFVFFNGDAKGPNATSLNFEAHAMGFFAGMVAAHMTKTNEIGIIAAFEWQPEVEGFYQGAQFENPNVTIHIEYVQGFDHVDLALEKLDKLVAENVDVVYPAGDRYNVPVIEKVKEKGIYSIGFVSDQSDLGEQMVLTSTVQHVDELYLLVAKKFIKGELESGNLYFDFQDGVIDLGKFSPLVDKEFKNKVLKYVEEYKKTGKLPNE
ncbi:MAG: BMP family ABC transporter substrate-binding protein [Bacillaceae bacterium]|jgi:Uncharacterized ABC-type transport system, periplasmic component/surface lipoprotein|uniref:BMP family ABC transporter substrate-binding protein n=1 Tax=Aeribacillus composti TaxID=1868734 RepID=A0ABY9WH41_9BACI|nr:MULTISPECIES: BMP family ABC transporter substrate-binding protein [Aeribacillus]REJ21127.1 MAG: BMP family ABC transporter substrate-binding protein [Bacillaceae bacterium]KZM55918.1 BMP family ABC transporter substrate-binding protein [Aeribacillus pallidus]MDR9796438.1 BMP family ABC transporter substrate-binding protein [Aeribacillus pallidus]MED0651246.1 BMP family ABC transporter substrate-binding protein [Aeribacillus composti]MED0716547.1 BMP family ABC transporter substrate-binding